MKKLFVLASIGMIVSVFLIGCGKGLPRPGDVLTPGGYRLFSSDWDSTEVSSETPGTVSNNSSTSTTVNSSGNQSNTSNNNGCSNNGVCAPKK